VRKRTDDRFAVATGRAVSSAGGDGVAMRSALSAERRDPERSAHCSSQPEREEEKERGELGTVVSSAATACPE
jgi:hypothetical protein